METTLFKLATYQAGETFGHYTAIALSIVMVLLILFVIFKYLDTSDLN